MGFFERLLKPPKLTHRMILNVPITKGETTGSILLPTIMNVLDYSVDLNPSLIRKKDRKVMKMFPVNKKISYDPDRYDVVLAKEEIDRSYELKELEKCGNCGQKVVIAELANVNVRGDPEVIVRLSSPADENLNVPINVGLSLPNDLRVFMAVAFHIGLAFFTTTLVLFFGNDFGLVGALSGIALTIAMLIFASRNLFILCHYLSWKKWNNHLLRQKE